MTKREFWLKYFNESDSALALAIYLCEQFAWIRGLGAEDESFITRERNKLDNEMPPKAVKIIFGRQDDNSCK